MIAQSTNRPTYILPIIIFSQFAGTSLWFAGNAVMPEIIQILQLEPSFMGYVTSAVQAGFIFSTLLFAIFTLSDLVSPVRLFFICATLGAISNCIIIFLPLSEFSILTSRFLTGVFLAGIYPVGMKISSDWYKEGLGLALGYLVGALVLGTALPHLMKELLGQLSWKNVIISTSLFAFLGGVIMILFVKNGPQRLAAKKFDITSISQIFKDVNFRKSAFGYFGHMWELYAFWSFLPLIIINYNELNNTSIQVSLFTFLIIAIGSISCILGGYLSKSVGSLKVANVSLFFSLLCCLSTPYLSEVNAGIFLFILFVWGFFVIMDSPQFSSMVAASAPPKLVGSALTIVNSIGFAITIVSIEIANLIIVNYGIRYAFVLLAIGPIFGLLSSKRV